MELCILIVIACLPCCGGSAVNALVWVRIAVYITVGRNVPYWPPE
jgi:hypothetical protein